MTQIEEILKKLRVTKHPEINASLVELGMIGDIQENTDEIRVELKLPFSTVPIKAMLEDIIKNALQDKGKKVTIISSEMDEQEKQNFFKLSREKWAL